MVAKQRDRIVIDSDRAGQPAREGEILEVIEASYGTRYRVAWDDGHESTIRPAGGMARVVHVKPRGRHLPDRPTRPGRCRRWRRARLPGPPTRRAPSTGLTRVAISPAIWGACGARGVPRWRVLGGSHVPGVGCGAGSYCPLPRRQAPGLLVLRTTCRSDARSNARTRPSPMSTAPAITARLPDESCPHGPTPHP